jgi:nucleoside-triphosphatase THEP1
MSRHGNRWTVNEILTLQREYELLGLSTKKIASRHKRTEDAIIMKLEAEGFFQEEQQDVSQEDSDPFVDVDSVENETINNCINDDLYEDQTEIDRIYKLECAVEEITHVVNELVKRFFTTKKTSKLYL